MSYIIVATPPIVENPLTEEEPVRITSGNTYEELMAAGAPTVTRPATIEAVELLGVGEVALELLQKHIGGYIEVAYSFSLDAESSNRRAESIDIIGDEEGLLKQLTPTLVRPTDGWVLRGPLVVCRCTTEGVHIGLDETQFNNFWGMFSVLGFVDVRRLSDG